MSSNASVLTPDLLAAKGALAARLLPRSQEPAPRAPALRMEDAVAAASHNVLAVGIGRKIVHGSATETTGLKVYVVQKLALSALPEQARLPETFSGIPVDVVEAPPSYLMGWPYGVTPCSAIRRRQQRPVTAGISAAHGALTAGTVGGFFRSTRAGDDPSRILVLSNNHVFANVNLGCLSDGLYQPGPADGAVKQDLFARLARFVPLYTDGKTPNRVDAAVGELLDSIPFKLEICTIGRIQGVRRATQDMLVRKHGRTTGYTAGIVTDESVDALVRLNGQDQVGLFQDQMRIEAIAPHFAIGLPGDSGSLIIDRSRLEAVGLFFAGPPSGSYGYANHIEHVLTDLELRIWEE
ncbi:MAG: hypothetical protein ACRD7E_12910 [Bryobacteraceae bacterium]